MKRDPDVYLIHPVTDITLHERESLDDYVRKIESWGYSVHYSVRDVNQVDLTGLRILSEHRDAMKKCREVHIYWNPKSRGSVGTLEWLLWLKNQLF